MKHVVQLALRPFGRDQINLVGQCFICTHKVEVPFRYVSRKGFIKGIKRAERGVMSLLAELDCADD